MAAIPPPEELGPIMRRAVLEALENAPMGASAGAVLGWIASKAERTGDRVVAEVVRLDRATVLEVIEATREELEGAESLYPVARVATARDPVAVVEWVDWPTLVRGLTKCRRVQGGKLDAPGWLPVEFAAGREEYRHRSNVGAIWALVCDLDEGILLHEVQEALRGMGLRYVLHTTWSHSIDHHKARVVLPLSEPCPAFRWEAVWAAGSRWAEAHGMTVDAACKDPSRYYVLPALPADASPQRVSWFVGESRDGDLLSWRELLHEYPPAPMEERPRTALTSLGSTTQELSQEERRRRGFARGLVRHRCQQVAAQGKGGRNGRTFAAARAVGQLSVSGVVDVDWALSEIEAAAMSAGLPAKEARRAVTQGYHYGQQDGEWQWD